MRLKILFALLVPMACHADFSTYIGDQFQYQVAAATSDAAGNTYVTGSRMIGTPTQGPVPDVFVTKLDASGNIVFTSTFGGKSADVGTCIAVDLAGNIWVGGSTNSDNLPLRNPLQSVGGVSATAGFVVKLAPDGSIIYSSYFGGVMGESIVNGIATDQSGDVYLTGTTSSSDFPTTPGLPAFALYDNGESYVYGAFITKLNSTGSKVLYSAVVGGLPYCTGVDCAQGDTTGFPIAVDSGGNAIIAGSTDSNTLPITMGAALPQGGGFVGKINAAGTALDYLIYVAGPYATGLATDASQNVYLTGTAGPGFVATLDAYQSAVNAAGDAYAMKLTPTGAIVWATSLGASASSVGNAISLDPSGDVWLAGTNAAGFTGGRLGAGAAGDFLAELSTDGSTLLYTSEFASGTAGQCLSIDPSGTLHFAGVNGIVSTAAAAQPISARVFGVVNAAGGAISGRIAPGEIISIFGFSIGPSTPATATPSNGKFPTALGGVQVLVNGAAIPLLYVSTSQINVEIPSPLNGSENGIAEIQVIYNSTTFPDFRVAVDNAIAGIFQNADGSAAAINQDGTLNSVSNPAKAGSIVSIWTTGYGFGSPAIDGSVSTSANNWCPACEISVNGIADAVLYAGAAPGLIDGVMQINFAVPSEVGISQYSLTFDNSNPVVVYVAQ